MNIVFITDENYALPTRAAIRSAIQNAAGNEPLMIYVVCVEVTEPTIEKFKALGTERVEVCIIRQSLFAEHVGAAKSANHVSTAALYKFYLPDLFPNLDKILYLDVDVIIVADLREFYAADLSGYYAAVVRDDWLFNRKHHLRLGVDDYFNSGVMLLNLAKLRQDAIPQRLLEYRKQSGAAYMDQDAFNAGFAGQVLFVDGRYNVFNNANYPEVTCKSIIHYASPLRKPWKYANINAANIFMDYLSPEDFHACLRNYFYSLQEDVSLEKLAARLETVEKLADKLRCKTFSYRWKRMVHTLFYEKRIDHNGVKRRIKFFGVGLFSQRKSGDKRELRILGFKINRVNK